VARSPSAAAAGLTAADLIVEAMERFADREAFVLGDQRVSYGQAADTISRIVRLLAARGVGPGRAVAALSPNMPEAWLVQAVTTINELDEIASASVVPVPATGTVPAQVSFRFGQRIGGSGGA